jgi:putative transposase
MQPAIARQEKTMPTLSTIAAPLAIDGDLHAAATRLRFASNDTLLITPPDGTARLLFVVVKRCRNGYVLRHPVEQSERPWPDDEIFGHYLAGRLEHFSANLTLIDAAQVEMLEADFGAFRPDLRFAARCRETYCREFERQRATERRIDALTGAIDVVYSQNRDEWTRDQCALDALKQAAIKDRRRKPFLITGRPHVVTIKRPSVHALRDWLARWRDSGRDVRALIPHFHRRGDHRARYEELTHLQTDPMTPLCVYGAMQFICMTTYLKVPRVTKAYGFRELNKLCDKHKLPKVTYPTFVTYLRDRFDAYQEYKARYGGLAAWYKFHIFDRREMPERPLAEVEVDHLLLDVFVRDRRGKCHRPWLTLFIDRCTRMVVGIHIGFDWPSYACVQRGLVHAISVKDLSGLEGLRNPWPCHGVFDLLITDRGLEFLSNSLRTACGDLGIGLLNLPGRRPNMKGAVERFFGTLNVRVFAPLEGATHCRDTLVYDPSKKARFTLEELTEKIVRWIVDDYHVTEHATLKTTPLAKWNALVADYGVAPVNGFQRLMTLLGERVTRTISNIGIQLEGHVYASPELEALRHRRGDFDKDWQLRIDPYDRGAIWVLDDERKSVLTVPAVHQHTASGISRFAARAHLAMARKITPPGEPITDQILIDAMRSCDEEAARSASRRAARYHATGDLATPVRGNTLVASLLGRQEVATEEQPGPSPTSTDTPAASASSSTPDGARLLDALLAERLAALQTPVTSR